MTETATVTVADFYRLVASRLEELGHVAEVTDGQHGWERKLTVDGETAILDARQGYRSKGWFVSAGPWERGKSKVCRGLHCPAKAADRAARRISATMPAVREANAKAFLARQHAEEAARAVQQFRSAKLDATAYGGMVNVTLWSPMLRTSTSVEHGSLIEDLVALKEKFGEELKALKEKHGVAN